MKKIISILLGSCLFIGILSGCNQTSTPAESSSTTNHSIEENSVENDSVETDNKISVVSTVFAPYDFTREIVGDHAEISMLLSPGSESHSFEPTPGDIMMIQNCDVFLYIGGDSDAWVERILASIDTSNIEIISLMDCVDVVTEEIVEGMQHDDHGHSHEGEDFDPADVKDRPMSDFDGDWISGIPLIDDGSLDVYIEHSAEENDVSFKEQKESLLTRWASDYDNISIDDSTLTINNISAEYEYKGYQLIESDHGSSVWYNYEISASIQDMPTYITFNDHSHGADDHYHDDEHGEISHFHLKYGDESFDSIINNNEWAPFYFDASHSNAEIGEFMAPHDDHDHEEPEDQHEDHEEETEFDEHVWTSPKNAKLIVQKILDAVCDADAGNSDIYKENTEAYLAKLDVLDASFQEVVDSATRKTLVFGDRFPFRYFADTYGLDYFAAFPGCSTETEASAATLIFLINKIKEENIPVVFHAELSNQRMANTISEETGAKVMLLHACHNVSKDEMEAGATYLSLMTQNIETLKEALE